MVVRNTSACFLTFLATLPTRVDRALAAMKDAPAATTAFRAACCTAGCCHNGRRGLTGTADARTGALVWALRGLYLPQ